MGASFPSLTSAAITKSPWVPQLAQAIAENRMVVSNKDPDRGFSFLRTA